MKNKKAFGVLELLLASSILVLLVTSIIGLLLYGRDSLDKDNISSRASLIASEGFLAIESIRDNNFLNLTDGVYGLVFLNGEWSLSGGYDEVGNFKRTVTISSISVNEKKVTIEVSWFKSFSRLGRVVLSRYFTDWNKESDINNDVYYSVDIYNDWGTGYCANVTVTTNSIDPILWEVEISLDSSPVNGTPYNVWNANWSFNEPIFTASGVGFNEYVSFNNPATFGYCANRPQDEDPEQEADYQIDIYNDWGTGYCANVTVSTDSVNPIIWFVNIDLSSFPENGIPYNVWNVEWDFQAPILNASGLEWNKHVSLNNPITFGYCANRPPPQSDYLIVDTSNIYVGGGGNRRVYNIYLSNNGTESLNLESINVAWTGSPASAIREVFINNGSIWSGNVSSGLAVDFVNDYVLSPFSGPHNMSFRFQHSFVGRTISYINFNFSDGSTRTIGPISL